MSPSFSAMHSMMAQSPPETYRGWLMGLDPMVVPASERAVYEKAMVPLLGGTGFLPQASFGLDSDRAQFRSCFAKGGSRAITPKLRLTTTEASSMLSGLVQANLSTMTAQAKPGDMPVLNGIREGRVRYDRADPGEHWQTWRELKAQIDAGKIAKGDCEDLASAVTAELIFNGVPARVYVYKSGPRLYHVVTKTAKWGLLDPSRAAGMGGNG